MKFKPGDPVSFINENQSGKVVETRSGGIVIVAIESGFDIPVHESELVKRFAPELENESAPEPAVKYDANADALIKGYENSLLFVVVPARGEPVNSGKVNVQLINRTEATVLFAAYLRQHEKWRLLETGPCAAASMAQLGVFTRKELDASGSFLVQWIAPDRSGTRPQKPSVRELSILLPSFSEPGSGNGFARIQVLSGSEHMPAEPARMPPFFGKDPDKAGSASLTSKRSGEKYGIVESDVEVDLHIEELVNDFGGLTNGEMLHLQLQEFSKTMEHALRSNISKIVFIHGVGNGTLKKAIRKELLNYPGVKFRDANPARYGRGATEVLMH